MSENEIPFGRKMFPEPVRASKLVTFGAEQREELWNYVFIKERNSGYFTLILNESEATIFAFAHPAVRELQIKCERYEAVYKAAEEFLVELFNTRTKLTQDVDDQIFDPVFCKALHDLNAAVVKVEFDEQDTEP